MAVVPGEAFGTPGYFRLSCALGDADLEEGISRIAELVGQVRLSTPGSAASGRSRRGTGRAGRLARWHGRSARCPRRTCTCTSPARCGTRRWSSWPRRTGCTCPRRCATSWPPQLSGADERGWFRFQRLYDIARSVLRTEADVRRLLRETAQDERAEGSGWLEIQVDPSGYAARFGGLTPTVELVLDAARGRGRGDRRRASA